MQMSFEITTVGLFQQSAQNEFSSRWNEIICYTVATLILGRRPKRTTNQSLWVLERIPRSNHQIHSQKISLSPSILCPIGMTIQCSKTDTDSAQNKIVTGKSWNATQLLFLNLNMKWTPSFKGVILLWYMNKDMCFSGQ